MPSPKASLLVLATIAIAVACAVDVSASTGGSPVDASAFAAGSCVAFEPTAGERGKTVFLDAGHGGIDPGGVGATEQGQTIDEASETLPVELDTMALLRGKGFRVVVSRTRASTVMRLGPGDVAEGALTLQGAHDDVAARDVCANRAHANVLVGIYFDASSSSSNAGSLTAYDPDRPFSPANLRLAELLQHDVLASMNAHGWGIPNDGVQPDTDSAPSTANRPPAASPKRPRPTTICYCWDRPWPATSRRPARCRARSSSRCTSPTPSRDRSPTAPRGSRR